MHSNVNGVVMLTCRGALVNLHLNLKKVAKRFFINMKACVFVCALHVYKLTKYVFLLDETH